MKDRLKEKNSRKSLKVIHSSAPIRINDIGGWTDTWFSREGKVLNMAVTPRIEVQIEVFEIRQKKTERVLVHAKNFGDTFYVDPEKPSFSPHPLLQGAINSLPVPEEFELEISINSPVPPGCSTGTSAAVCVALLGGLDLLTPYSHSPEEIASLAHSVETDKLGLQSGIQDQLCAAHGGICFINMFSYPKAIVSKLELNPKVKSDLNKRLCLIYLGTGHISSALHEEVIAFLEEQGSQFKKIQQLRELACRAKDCLFEGDLKSFGEIMIQNNECQRSLHPELICQDADFIISLAKKWGAAGWKVNGAGGKGGSLTILTSKDDLKRARMIEEIKSLKGKIKHIPISLAASGLKVSQSGFH